MDASATPPPPLPAGVPPGFAPRPVTGGFLVASGPIYARRDPAGGPTAFGLLVQAQHCNGMDMCHGGMLATFADVALGLGGFEQAGAKGFFITISLTTDFLAPAPLGAWVECRPELVRATRTMVFAQGVFRVPGQGAVLRASGVFRIPPPRPG